MISPLVCAVFLLTMGNPCFIVLLNYWPFSRNYSTNFACFFKFLLSTWMLPAFAVSLCEAFPFFFLLFPPILMDFGDFESSLFICLLHGRILVSYFAMFVSMSQEAFEVGVF